MVFLKRTPLFRLLAIGHGRLLHGSSTSLKPDIAGLANELAALFLALIAGLLDEVASIVVAPNLVQAHGKLVVAVRKHSLKVKLLLSCQLAFTLAVPNSVFLATLLASIFLHQRLLLFKDIVEI